MTGAESGTRLSACPYTALTRLDARASVADTFAHSAPMARFIARGTDGERTVRALAVVLAETLAVLQGQNVTHAGASPAAILITADGPRLTCFGAVRAAAADGVPRHGTPGPDAGGLPPEQAACGWLRPLGDVYALGATPAYAATGYTAPERDELPPSLRSLVGRSLSGDPARRPPIAGMIHALVDDSGSPSPTGFGPVTRAEALPGPGWLPPRVIAAIAHRSASVPAADVATAA
ncbi:serine/threonine-protein kinase [Streptomyces prasinus]|uniref:serine/threonine protein kinase n=1 Tax=Streptomyces prasinus TaxID=67345 RepID=UPI0036C44381